MTELGYLPADVPEIVSAAHSRLGIAHRAINCVNEDAYSIAMRYFPTDDDVVEHHTIHHWSFFSVIDGHGGAQCSAFCAQRLQEILMAKMRHEYESHFGSDKEPDVDELEAIFVQSFEQLEGEFMAGAEKAKDDSGACVISAIVTHTDVIVANCGDCAGLLIRYNGKGVIDGAEWVNARHWTNNKDEADRVRRAGSRISMGRVCDILEPTRTIGDRDVKSNPGGKGVIATPEVRHLRLDAWSSWVLVLASDGLWDALNLGQVLGVLRGPVMSQEDALEQARILADMASAGSDDDITVLVVGNVVA